jgi:beta-galactosidase
MSPHTPRSACLPLALALLALAAPLPAAPPESPRAKYNFNPDWLLNVGNAPGADAPAFADASWQKISLPHAWNEDSAFKVSIEQLPIGIAWYRKHFKLPANAAGKKVFLEFEGIRFGGEFYLNGEPIGRHENGVMAFGFDISEKVKPAPQENVLAARIDNAWNYHEKDTNSTFQWNDKNFNANYGGINKNVFLHVTDKLHQTLPLYSNLGTTGVYVYAQDFDIPGKSAKITAESQVKNEDSSPKTVRYEVSIADPDGKTIKTFDGGETAIAPGETKTLTAGAKIDNLHFWSWGYGYLYDVTTTLKVNGQPVDAMTTRTGFRKTEFANGVVKLNDRVIQLKGYAQRSTNEWPAIGSSVPPWVSDLSNSLMVQSNANLVRWMHVTPWKQDIESCDRVGLLQAMPAGDSERDPDGRRWEQRVEVMRDATIYNRNNPSIVFYEGGNKGISEAHMQQLKTVRDQYDPHGGRASGSREMLDSKVAEYGGEMLYINKSARLPMWAMEYSRDEALRKYQDEWTPPFHKNGDGPMHNKESGFAYNRNQDSQAIEDVVRWYDYWRERPGTGKRVSSGGVNIVFSDSNTHHRGVENYRRSGEVDAMRIPKEGFFAHQVMWDGWVDVEKPRIHLIGHWNYEPGTKKPVYAVSSADKAELFLNGKSLGFGEQSSRFLYTWKDVAWQPGEIEVIGYDAAGKLIATDHEKTAGSPAAVHLIPLTGPGGLKADGADLALVNVVITDGEGNLCPTALNLVRFELTGPAEWRGGIAQGPENYILSKELPVECGMNAVILRSRPQPGKITLRATVEGLKPAADTLISLPISVTDGLATALPADGLEANLGRGPTPPGDSITPTRQPVKIANATAGANAEQAAQSFDDDEETGWKNDDRRDTGWIQYELERPAHVSELTLKMGGWRSRSYPIRILVDGKEVFAGNTERTLGYTTIPVKPTMGKTVRIELAGAIQEKDAFGMEEVTGKKLDDAAASGVKGTLEIIEAEIYEPLSK